MAFDRNLRLTAAMVFLTLAACMPAPLLPPWDTGFSRIEDVRVDHTTRGWLKTSPGHDNRPLVVVIEGDGATWGIDGKPPLDPTPRSGTGAKLAAALARGRTLLYLARPCQYLSPDQLTDCSIHYWTDQRFGRETVSALDRLIDQVQINERKIILIGFSGGGVLAADLALKRKDVAGLITVAAPLDLEAWTRFHNISPLKTIYLNGKRPQALAHADFFQTHLFGTRDLVVPVSLTENMVRQLPKDAVLWAKRQKHDDDWLPMVAPALTAMEKKISAQPINRN